MGMRLPEIRNSIDEVLDFAELHDAIDRPLKTYSSGMRARLAFAIATLQVPEILLIDEALAVGDRRFRSKSLKRINAIRYRAHTIVMVTHNVNEIRKSCNRCMWIDNGPIEADGDVEEVLALYLGTDEDDDGRCATGLASVPAPDVDAMMPVRDETGHLEAAIAAGAAAACAGYGDLRRAQSRARGQLLWAVDCSRSDAAGSVPWPAVEPTETAAAQLALTSGRPPLPVLTPNGSRGGCSVWLRFGGRGRGPEGSTRVTCVEGLRARADGLAPGAIVGGEFGGQRFGHE